VHGCAQIKKESQEDIAFREVRTIEKDWLIEDINYFDMSIAQESSLRDIAQGHTQSAFTAQSYLFLRNREEFPFSIGDWPDLIADYAGENIEVIFKGNSSTPKNHIQLYPNPTDAQLMIELAIPDCEQLQFQVFDNQGQEVHQESLNNNATTTLDTTKWPVGLYYYEITDNEELIQKDKLLIVR